MPQPRVEVRDARRASVEYPGILAHHDAQRQRDLGRDPADEREVRGQPAIVDGTHDFEPVGAASRRFARVGNALDDHFEKNAH